MTWLKEVVIFFFWAYREFKDLRNEHKACKEAQCTLNEVEKFLNKEKEREENAK